MPYRRGASFIVTLRAKESFSRLALEFRDPDRQPLGRGEGGNLGRVRSRPAPLDDPQASDEGQPRACRATLQQGRGDRSALRRTSEDRKSVVLGKSGSVRVDLGGRRIIKKKIQ